MTTDFQRRRNKNRAEEEYHELRPKNVKSKALKKKKEKSEPFGNHAWDKGTKL